MEMSAIRWSRLLRHNLELGLRPLAPTCVVLEATPRVGFHLVVVAPMIDSVLRGVLGGLDLGTT